LLWFTELSGFAQYIFETAQGGLLQDFDHLLI